jgi:hypothetical protein
MRYLLPAALVLSAAVSHATTLVALWSPGEVLLAADSAVIKTAGDLNFQTVGCKIGEGAGTYYELSGLIGDEASGYSAIRYASQAATSGGHLETEAASFVAAARDPLTKELNSVRSNDPTQFAFLVQGHPALQAIFAGMEDGQPALAVAGFGVAPSGELNSFVRVIAKGDDGRGPRIIYAGQQSRIKAYLGKHPDWYQGDRIDLVRKLVQMEIDGSEGQVAGPVDVLSIDNAGAHWIQHKESCR